MWDLRLPGHASVFSGSGDDRINAWLCRVSCCLRRDTNSDKSQAQLLVPLLEQPHTAVIRDV